VVSVFNYSMLMCSLVCNISLLSCWL